MFQIVSKTGTTAQIKMIGVVGSQSENMSAEAFAEKLEELDGMTEIEATVHSGGGSVMEGIAMVNVIRSSKAKFKVKIIGLCASMMSIIAMEADDIEMAENAHLMIHKPSGFVAGSADQLRSQAILMDNMAADFSVALSKRSGKTIDEVNSEWLQTGVDKWFTAAEAKEAGLIDRVFKGGKKVQLPKAISDLPLKEVIQAYGTIDKKNMNEVIAFLGITASASEAQVVAAIRELKVKAQRVEAAEAEAKQAKEKQTEAEAKADKAIKQAATEKIEVLVNGAVNAGKIMQGDKDRYVKLATADFDTTKELLDSMQAYVSVNGSITGANTSEKSLREKFAGKTWDDLHKSNDLAAIKASAPEFFEELKTARFN